MTFHQLGESGTAFSLEDYAFVIENALSTFHSDSSFLLLSRTMRGSFSGLHHETPVGFLEVKPTKVSRILSEATGVSYFHISPHSASSSSLKLPLKYSNQFMSSAPSK